MPFPVSYFDDKGKPLSGGDESIAVSYAKDEGVGAEAFATVIRALDRAGLVATRKIDPFAGQVARVQIDAFGESAAEVESTLLNFGGRCDAAAQAAEVSYGRCVIERNLEEQWGATYSWRGRLTLHPTIGTIPSSERAAKVIGESLDRDPRD